MIYVRLRCAFCRPVLAVSGWTVTSVSGTRSALLLTFCDGSSHSVVVIASEAAQVTIACLWRPFSQLTTS
jgi:hypothetical protein